MAEPANQIAEVEVSELEPFICWARLTGPWRGKVKAESLREARAVETRHNFHASQLKVWLKDAGIWGKKIDEMKVATTQGVTPDNYDVLVRHDREALVLERKDGSIRSRIREHRDTAEHEVHDALLGEWRWQFLSRLRNDNQKALKIALKIVPLDVQKNEQGQIIKVFERQVKRTDGNRLVLVEGDYFTVALHNDSPAPCWVTVLELDPKGQINPIFPHPQVTH